MKHVALFLLAVTLTAGQQDAGAQRARLVPYHKGDKWGYADQHRRVVLPLRYDDAGPFVDELAWVRLGSRYGYIDGGGNPLTPIQYTRAENFCQGRATVALQGETFAIGPDGHRLPESGTAAVETDDLSQGDLFRQEGKVGFRFTVGQTVVPAEYDEIRENYNGLLFVRQGQHWGVVNHKGKLVQPVQFDHIQTDAASLVFPVVERGSLFGYLDEEGNELTEPKYQQAAPFVAGVARVVTPAGQVGYINTDGVEFFEAE